MDWICVAQVCASCRLIWLQLWCDAIYRQTKVMCSIVFIMWGVKIKWTLTVEISTWKCGICQWSFILAWDWPYIHWLGWLYEGFTSGMKFHFLGYKFSCRDSCFVKVEFWWILESKSLLTYPGILMDRWLCFLVKYIDNLVGTMLSLVI
jgi:hypothetical protein